MRNSIISNPLNSPHNNQKLITKESTIEAKIESEIWKAITDTKKDNTTDKWWIFETVNEFFDETDTAFEHIVTDHIQEIRELDKIQDIDEFIDKSFAFLKKIMHIDPNMEREITDDNNEYSLLENKVYISRNRAWHTLKHVPWKWNKAEIFWWLAHELNHYLQRKAVILNLWEQDMYWAQIINQLQESETWQKTLQYILGNYELNEEWSINFSQALKYSQSREHYIPPKIADNHVVENYNEYKGQPVEEESFRRWNIVTEAYKQAINTWNITLEYNQDKTIPWEEYFNWKRHKIKNITEKQARENSTFMDKKLESITEQNKEQYIEEIKTEIETQYKQATWKDLDLTPEQVESILDAHKRDWILGKLTSKELKVKVKTLSESINDKEVRRFLLEAGFCGWLFHFFKKRKLQKQIYHTIKLPPNNTENYQTFCDIVADLDEDTQNKILRSLPKSRCYLERFFQNFVFCNKKGDSVVYHADFGFHDYHYLRNIYKYKEFLSQYSFEDINKMCEFQIDKKLLYEYTLVDIIATYQSLSSLLNRSNVSLVNTLVCFVLKYKLDSNTINICGLQYRNDENIQKYIPLLEKQKYIKALLPIISRYQDCNLEDNISLEKIQILTAIKDKFTNVPWETQAEKYQEVCKKIDLFKTYFWDDIETIKILMTESINKTSDDLIKKINLLKERNIFSKESLLLLGNKNLTERIEKMNMIKDFNDIFFWYEGIPTNENCIIDVLLCTGDYKWNIELLKQLYPYCYRENDKKDPSLFLKNIKLNDKEKILNLYRNLILLGIPIYRSVPILQSQITERINSQKNNIETYDWDYNQDLSMLIKELQQKWQFRESHENNETIKIHTQYPSDKYLYSWTQVSDDYFSLSKRWWRTGILYWTLHVSYATWYSGTKGGSATGDTYINNYIWNNITMWFINIYQRSKDDQWFGNFWVEKQKIGILPRTITNPENNSECETYITKEKNPLISKFMIIKTYKPEHYLYYEIPKTLDPTKFPDKLVSYFLKQRKADIHDTYSQDFLDRIQE